jgi:hypothetical protein
LARLLGHDRSADVAGERRMVAVMDAAEFVARRIVNGAVYRAD